MPPSKIALRSIIRWCGVIVAASVAGPAVTKSAASFVVMCSNTIFRPGKSFTRRFIVRSMNTASRSKMSTALSVTSPCTSSFMPIFCMRSSAGAIFAISVTPWGGVRRRVSRIEFGGDPHPLGIAAFDLVGRDPVGEIAGHQRLESGTGGLADARGIVAHGRHAGGRRNEIGHHDGACELARGVRGDGFQHGAVAQMHVPVVGPADDEAVGHGRVSLRTATTTCAGPRRQARSRRRGGAPAARSCARFWRPASRTAASRAAAPRKPRD